MYSNMYISKVNYKVHYIFYMFIYNAIYAEKKLHFQIAFSHHTYKNQFEGVQVFNPLFSI